MSITWKVLLVALCNSVLSSHLTEGTIEKSMLDYTMDFCVELFKEEAYLWRGNVVLAPVNVHLLLVVLQQGAKGNTLKQLQYVLNATPATTYQSYFQFAENLKGDEHVTVEIDNAAFIAEGLRIRPMFKTTMVPHFLSEVKEVDFRHTADTAGFINSWVAYHTHQRIPQLLSPDDLSPTTRAVLTSALYFKGQWKTPFPELKTSRQSFFVSRDRAAKVSMMSNKAKFRTGEFTILQSRWLDLPFQGDRFSMLVVLPNDEGGLYNLLDRISGQHIQEILYNTEQNKMVQVYLPRFKLKHQSRLNDTLKKFGLEDMFNAAADFSAMSGDNLYMNDIFQKAEIEVDEQGATASAAAGAVTAAKQSNAVSEFRADHPFLVFVIDKLNEVPLFAGRVSNPSK